MQQENTIRRAVDIITGHNNSPLAILHCVSGYPQLANETNLSLIPKYREEFPNLIVGYSGHEEGTAITLAAVALGAKIVERHVTLDKTIKGTDHKCSLLPEELKQLIQEIRTIEVAIGQPVKTIQTCEIPCKHKLGKTLVAARNLTTGDCIKESDINVKVSVPRGIEAEYIDEVIGKVCKTDILEDSPIGWENLVYLN
ncbi:hypothetical protein QYM36_003954 [Artemia franciscana]|nr:hypothetical protein QYM36_003954 [Artemia franciscana]